ncbi:MAG: CDP-alcohol phosphatidyltransferase family protein [bacterium]
MKSLITWRQLVPISITLMAMLCGFFSILVTMESMNETLATAGAMHRWAALLIMLAMILDGIDGNVARKLKGVTDIGAELDTYVDMTAFGIAPAVLIYVVMLTGSVPQDMARIFWRVGMTAVVVLSGVVRLARFKAKDPARGQGGYTGLPITACAGWVAMLVFISQSEPFEKYSLNTGWVAALFLAGVLIFISLQVSNVRYPKPTKHPALFIPMVIMVCVLFGPQKIAVPAAVFMILMVLGYIAFGPFYMRQALRRASLAAGPEPSDLTHE